MFQLKDVTVGKKEILAGGSAFFSSGFGFATWASMIPFLKLQLGAPADVLGLLLLCIGAAACVAMPAAGIFLRYFGCRAVGTVATGSIIFVLAAVPQISSVPVCAIVLLLMGASVGTLDVAMNLNAVVVETASGKRLMSRMHAFYSIGCCAGAGSFALLMKAGLPLSILACVHGGVLAALMLLFYRNLLPFHGEDGKKKFVRPRGVALLLGVMACLGFLTEGAVMDWGGVLLHEGKGIELSLSSLGFTCYFVSQLAARLSGNFLFNRFGEKFVVLGGVALTMACFAGIIWAENFTALLACFFVAGAALANVIPTFYSWISRQKEMPVGDAVTAVTFLGYAGLILGPSLLGFCAQHLGISSVFEICILFLALLSAAIWDVLRKTE